MKNPLVDALRQAERTDVGGDAEARVEGKVPVTQSSSGEQGVSEHAYPDALEIICDPSESAQIESGPTQDMGIATDASANDDQEPIANNSVEKDPVPADTHTDPAHAIDAEATTVDESSQVAEESARVSTSSAAPADRLFHNVARLTPAIFLALISAAAAGSLLVERLAQLRINQDLDGMSSRARPRVAEIQHGEIDYNASVMSVVYGLNGGVAANGRQAIVVPDTESGRAIATVATKSPSTSLVATTISPTTVTRNHDKTATSNTEAYAAALAGYEAYKAHSFDIAEEYYLRAISVEPNHQSALAGIAAVYQQTGRPQQAEETYHKLLVIDPSDTVAASALIASRSKAENWDSESDLKLLLQQFPDAHHLHFALGMHFVKNARWVDARHEFLSAHYMDLENADYAYNAAVTMEHLGDYDTAKRFFELALANSDVSPNFDRTLVAQHLTDLSVQLRDLQ